MKKQKVLAMVLALVMVLLAGCGEGKQESEYVGLWKATTAELSDVTVNVEDVYGVMTLTVDNNGKATIVTEDDNATDPWDATEEGLVIHSEGRDLKLKKVKDNVLAGDFGGVTLSFERTKDD